MLPHLDDAKQTFNAFRVNRRVSGAQGRGGATHIRTSIYFLSLWLYGFFGTLAFDKKPRCASDAGPEKILSRVLCAANGQRKHDVLLN